MKVGLKASLCLEYMDTTMNTKIINSINTFNEAASKLLQEVIINPLMNDPWATYEAAMGLSVLFKEFEDIDMDASNAEAFFKAQAVLKELVLALNSLLKAHTVATIH